MWKGEETQTEMDRLDSNNGNEPILDPGRINIRGSPRDPGRHGEAMEPADAMLLSRVEAVEALAEQTWKGLGSWGMRAVGGCRGSFGGTGIRQHQHDVAHLQV